MKEGVQASSQKRSKRQDLPTPLQTYLMVRLSAGVKKRTRVPDEQELYGYELATLLTMRISSHDQEIYLLTLIRKS